MQDELSFQDIVLRIWSRRGILATMVLVGLLGGGAMSLLWLGFNSGDVVSHVSLKGIEKGRYPGGAAFSPKDLQSPEVVSAAAQAVGLDAGQVEALQTGLSIEYGSPETYGIIKKHRERLEGKNLSVGEIDVLNRAFKDELEAANSGSLKLMISPPTTGLSKGLAQQLLQSIPAQWTRIYSERYRIYEPPGLELAAATMHIESLRTSADVVAAINSVNSMGRGLETIEKDNRIRHVVNSSGHSAAELLERYRVFRNTQFDPLIQVVLDTPDAVTESYRTELRLRIQYLEDQIEGFDRISEALVRGRESAAAEWMGRSDASTVNQLQLSGDSLATIIELTERASSAEFLREVMMDRHSLARDLALAKVDLARLVRPTRHELQAKFFDSAERNLAELTREYTDLYNIAVEKLRTELGTLYSVSAAPTEIRDLDMARILTRMAGLVLLLLFVGMLIVFIAPDRTGR